MEKWKRQTLARDSVANPRLALAHLPTLYTIGTIRALSAHAELVAKVVLLGVEVAPEPRTALDAVHAGDGAVAGLPERGGAHPAAAAVVEHGAFAARRARALLAWAADRAVHGVGRGARRGPGGQQRGQAEQ